MSAILAAEDVHKRYGMRRVLRGVTVEAHAGQRVAILGENGSGKSTLLRILAGAEELDRGRVTLRGTIGYCPQEQAVYPYLTVEEHLELFALAYGLAGPVARANRERLFERFDLGPWRRQLVQELSGGTRQKLNLAISVLHDPAVVLLDEPYAGFDMASYRAFVAWADDAKRSGKCVIVIAHLVLESERFEAVWHLRGGKLHAQDS